jgi:O-antigen ligase
MHEGDVVGIERGRGSAGMPAVVGASARDWRAAVALLIVPLAIVFRITILLRKRAGRDFATVDEYAAAQAVMVGLTLLILALTPRLIPTLRKLVRTSVGMFLGFYALCGLSAVWSPEPAYSLYRAVEAISQFLAILLAFSLIQSFRRAEKLALGLALTVLVLDVLGRGKLTGFTAFHTNTFTASGSMIACYCFGEFLGADRRRKRMLLSCMVLGLVAVAVGTSGTSNVGTVCGVMSAGLVRRGRLRTVILVLLLALVLAWATGLYGELEDAAFGALFPGKSRRTVEGLSGRLYIWQWAKDKIEDKWLIGHGFGVATRMDRRLNALTAHNILLAILLDTGVMGALAFCASIAFFFREMVHLPKVGRLGVTGCWCALTAAFVNCLGVPFLAVHWAPPSFVFGIFIALYLHHVLLAGGRTGPRRRPARAVVGP